MKTSAVFMFAALVVFSNANAKTDCKAIVHKFAQRSIELGKFVEQKSSEMSGVMDVAIEKYDAEILILRNAPRIPTEELGGYEVTNRMLELGSFSLQQLSKAGRFMTDATFDVSKMNTDLRKENADISSELADIIEKNQKCFQE